MRIVTMFGLSIAALSSSADAVVLPNPTTPIQIKCNQAAQAIFASCVDNVGVADGGCDAQAQSFYFNCIRGNGGIE